MDDLLDPELAEMGTCRLPRAANRRWMLADTDREWDDVDTERETRSRRCLVNLRTLRAPLAGVDLDSRDHAMLTWLADHDADVVAAVGSLLDRARAATPLPDEP